MDTIVYYVRQTALEKKYYACKDIMKREVKNFLLAEMKKYYCPGCHWCCYREKGYQEHCERRFTLDSELPEYIAHYLTDHIRLFQVRFTKNEGVTDKVIKSGEYLKDKTEICDTLYDCKFLLD